jgi:hypothetical protein
MRIRSRRTALLAAVPVLAATLIAAPVPASAVTTTLTPVADAYVQADQPTVNFGTSPQLHVDASPVTNSYLKFDVEGFTARPAQATLRVFTESTGSVSAKLSTVADSAWTETGITYAGAPALGTMIGQSGALTAGTWVSFDVTAQIAGNGLVSFGLSTGSTAVRIMDSREGANPPQLVLTPPPPPSNDPAVAVVGDIACAPSDPDFNGGLGDPGHCHMKATSDLVLAMAPTTTFMLGDAQYNSGAPADFAGGYDPSWGRLKANTRPVVGNHEYGTSGAAGYFGYFGDAATPLQPGCLKNCNGWYSFDVGTWHIVVLNSECTRVNGGTGCAAGSPQQQWLDADLSAHASACTAVLEHRPRWSSNSFASADVQPLVDTMYAHNVDLLLTGHAHSYERFAPQNASGARDDARGIREIVVGSGGAFYTGFGATAANSEVHKPSIFGVLKLTLHPSSYDWSFVPDPSTPFADAGTGTCH